MNNKLKLDTLYYYAGSIFVSSQPNCDSFIIDHAQSKLNYNNGNQMFFLA